MQERPFQAHRAGDIMVMRASIDEDRVFLNESLLPLKAVRAKVGIGTTAIYERMKSGTFPKPVKEGTRSLWIASEVDGWIKQRIKARNMG